MAGIREAASRVVGRAVAAVVMVPLLLGACASTPESRLRGEIWDIYWWSAKTCGARFTPFYVENVKTDGTVNLVGHTSVGIEDFRACYWKGVQTGIEKRRGAGLPVPESVNLQPPVDIDLD
jgi:hypothetical protein